MRLIKASEATSNEHPYRPICLTNLGRGRIRLFTTGGDLSELSTVRTDLEAALRLLPIGHRDRPMALLELATANSVFYIRDHNRKNLDVSLSYSSEALAITINDHPLRAAALWRHSAALTFVYDPEGDPETLDETVALDRHALELCSPEHPRREAMLGNLASHLMRRYRLNTRWTDMEEAIRTEREVSTLRGPEHPARASCLHNLALYLLHRYELLGHDSDLYEAIMAAQESVVLRPRGHPAHSSALAALINALTYLYEMTGDQGHIFKAINLATEYLEDPANVNAQIRTRLALAAGLAYLKANDHVEDISYLEEAARMFSFVEITSTQTVGYMLAESQHYHALALRSLYASTKDPKTVEQAMDLIDRAIEGCTPDNPLLQRRLCTLAYLHLLKNTKFFNPLRAIQSLTGVIQAVQTHPFSAILPDLMDVLETLEEVLNYDELMPSWQMSILYIYEHASALLPQLAYLGLDSRSRLRVLQRVDSLGTKAAIYALLCNRLERVVELQEETHAIFWTHALHLKTPLDKLPTQAGEELRLIMGQLKLEQPDESARGDNVARQRDLCKQLETLLDTIRKQPGLERFWMPETYETISQAALHGPVVVLLQDRSRAFGLVIRAPGRTPEKVELPHISDAVLTQMMEGCKSVGAYTQTVSSTRGLRVSGGLPDQSQTLLHDLWVKAMGPIIQALGIEVR